MMKKHYIEEGFIPTLEWAKEDWQQAYYQGFKDGKKGSDFNHSPFKYTCWQYYDKGFSLGESLLINHFIEALEAKHAEKVKELETQKEKGHTMLVLQI